MTVMYRPLPRRSTLNLAEPPSPPTANPAPAVTERPAMSACPEPDVFQDWRVVSYGRRKRRERDVDAGVRVTDRIDLVRVRSPNSHGDADLGNSLRAFKMIHGILLEREGSSSK